MYYAGDDTSHPEKRGKLEHTAKHQLLKISVASNVRGYDKPQCFVVNDKGRVQALQTVMAFMNHRHQQQQHQKTNAEKASELELQLFTLLLNHIKEIVGPFSQPLSSQASKSEECEEEIGESTGFDDDSDDKSDDEAEKKIEPL